MGDDDVTAIANVAGRDGCDRASSSGGEASDGLLAQVLGGDYGGILGEMCCLVVVGPKRRDREVNGSG